MVLADGKIALDHYEEALRSEEDLSAVTIRNYLSDVRQFAAWYEERSQGGPEETSPFTPAAVATPTLTAYRAFLQHILHLKPASVNRSLVSPHDLRHRFGYRMAALVPLHRLAQLMGHDSLDTTLIYARGTRSDLQQDVEKIAWV